MQIAVFAYSRQGCLTAGRIGDLLRGEQVRKYTLEKYLDEGFSPLEKPSADFYGAMFRSCDALIFVSSCGIAVRQIAPFVRDKKTDPAVIVVDELGKFTISLLSGHIGGANELAGTIAGGLQSIPVVTTATDINRKFSVDAWAARNGYSISDMKAAKAVSAEILERTVPMKCCYPVAGALPAGVAAGDRGPVGILISPKEEEPFDVTLRLIPKVLHLGIGCRRGTPAEVIRQGVEEVLKAHNIDRRAVRCAASIDLKADEQGLLAFCREEGLPVSFYSAQELLKLPGEFSKSKFVDSITGVDCVCERAAMVGAEKLIIRKTVSCGITVAVSEENLEVHFG